MATTIYNIFFHPLKKFPGPWHAAASRIPYLLNVVKGKYLPWNQSLHEKYGQVVRVAPDELSFTDGRAWKDIYGFQKGGNGMPSGNVLQTPRPGFLITHLDSFVKDLRFYPLANAVYPEIRPMVMDVHFHSHARVRKIFSNAFSNQALKKQEPLLRRHTELLLQAIQQKASTKFNLVTLFNFITFDIMGELAFGDPLGLLDGNEHWENWIRDIYSDIKASVLFRAGLYFPLLMKLLEFWVPKKLQEERIEGVQLANARVDARLAKNTDHPDIWSLTERKDGDGRPTLSLPEMHVNAASFMLAGTETSATLLSGLFYLLLKNPAKLELLTDEIRRSFSSPDEMSLERLPRLKYLTACIEETLRMYPPVPFGLGRFTPKGGAMICDRWVPEGVSISEPFLCRAILTLMCLGMIRL